MFWEDDDNEKEQVTASEEVVDVSYRIRCRQLPTSHAQELAESLYVVLPWLKDEKSVAIQQIHGAASGNGWERPADGEMIQLSRRTRMQLRIPSVRLDAAASLSGITMDVAGNSLTVGEMSVKPISPVATLLSRYMVVPDGCNEESFISWVAAELERHNIQVKKVLCGKGHEIVIGGDVLQTRSLMIADLDKASSVLLQEAGLGPHRHFGCGIFLPHKSIKAVSKMQNK